jgi:hypothetical protein
MKILTFIGAIAMLAALAFAQQQPKEPAGGKPGDTQAGASATPTPGGSSSEMKFESYSGTLVDANCAAGAPAASANRSQEHAGANAATPGTPAAGGKEPGASGAESSTGADQSQCPVSTSTSKFALKLNDGRTLKFDEVGNQRTLDAIKQKKKWSDAAGSGKPIHAKTTGVVNGDRLMVLGIH